MKTGLKTLRAIDLFSGCGGLTLGLKQAGFNVVGAIEKDALAVKTYRANHPEVKIWDRDIRQISIGEVLFAFRLKPGQLDLLAGCPPCQGFSSMTTLNGKHVVNDERNDLVFEYLRFVKGLRPKALMLENVPGLSRDYRFQKLCSELQTMGYYIDWDVKDAQHYGVPQRRKRVILLASLTGRIPFANRQMSKTTVRQTIANLPPNGKSGDLVHDLSEKRTPDMQDRIAETPKNGGSRLDTKTRLPCHSRCSGFKDVYGRMKWDEVAPTITSGCFNPSKGRFLHPEENRAITMREAALLQSFPRDYRFPECKNKGAVALMIGNALPPEFIRRHATEIRKQLAAIKAT
jgi:DNA (cytosine-5)-methyltransferase 1